mgnify:CR=1 FL=1
MRNQDEIIKETINNLSDLRRIYLRIAAEQQYNPHWDADRSDAEISDAKKKGDTMKRLRDEFEICVTGVVGY